MKSRKKAARKPAPKPARKPAPKPARKPAPKPALSPARLAARERAIVADIKAGKLSYRQIAKKHGVSLPTVNNKARKAGISRGRRPGAPILVAGPKRAPVLRPALLGKAAVKAAKRAKTAKKAAKAAPKASRTVAKAGRKTTPARRGPARATARAAKKAGRATTKAAPAPIVPMPVVAARPAPARRAPKAGRKSSRPRPAASRAGFSDALREVILKYHPAISLRAYERLMKAVQSALA